MTEEQEPAQPALSAISLQKALIRRRFLESVTLVLAVLALVGLPLSLSRIPQFGLHPIHLFHIFDSVLVLLAFGLRKRLPERWLAGFILYLLYGLSIFAFWQYGLVSAGFFFAAVAIFVTTVSMGPRAGLVSTTLFGAFICLMAWLWISGQFKFPGDANIYILLPSVWGTLGAAFLITTAVLFVSAAGFFRDLNELVDTIEAQKTAIEEHSRALAKANQELDEALRDIKTLSGLLPICAKCKKIRDDQGYWQKVERFLEQHSGATFTHGLCPDCMREMFPDLADKVLNRLEHD